MFGMAIGESESELGIRVPVGDPDTGDTTGRYPGDDTWHGISCDDLPPLHVDAPWTCEDCPQNLTVNKKHPAWIRTFGGKHFFEMVSDQGELLQMTTLPERCRDCDTRYRKHKRTTRAIVRIYRHPYRQEFCEESKSWWNRTDQVGHDHRFLKFICLTTKNKNLYLDFGPDGQRPSSQGSRRLADRKTSGASRSDFSESRGQSEGLVSIGSCQSNEGGFPQRANSACLQQPCVLEQTLVKFANNCLSEMKEKFRRARKRNFWTDHAVYGRWFGEVTWHVHYSDGTKWPSSDKGSQWMPSSKELEGATHVEVHPHLHVIAVAKFMDKDDLTEWWGEGTQIQSTTSWWSTKKYLTKYLNKCQLEGRHQGTFGKANPGS